MTPENFVYWLQGFIETAEPKTLSAKQLQIIKDHLDLVFDKQTPCYITPSDESIQRFCATQPYYKHVEFPEDIKAEMNSGNSIPIPPSYHPSADLLFPDGPPCSC